MRFIRGVKISEIIYLRVKMDNVTRSLRFYDVFHFVARFCSHRGIEREFHLRRVHTPRGRRGDPVVENF